MACEPRDLVVRVAGVEDLDAIAALRSMTGERDGDEPGFEERMAGWLTAEGDRRTTWLATAAGSPIGMASMLEYHRMPRPGRADSRWGYVGNMFVREGYRNRGIGSALLTAIIAAAEERGYARLVLSPSERALPFYRRAGFVVPDHRAGDDRLLVRPAARRPR
jgi:GNAT superfamily N-acetyltransferase